MECKLIELPRIRDPRGNLTFIENATHLPFDIRRVYWLYDVPSDGHRDGHAFRTQMELIVALSGSFDVTVDDGKEQHTFTLNRPYLGLLVPAMTWRSISNFSANAAGMVLASTLYDATDYIRNYTEFKALADSPVQAPPPPAEPERPQSGGHGIATVDDCVMLTLPRHSGPMGSLTPVENTEAFPFSTKRVYYLYDVPAGAERGGHSHHTEQRLITALAGAFDVTVDDGHNQRTFTLNNPGRALYIPAGIWRTVQNFSSGSVCLALSSKTYDAADYVRSYAQFKCLTK